MQTEKKYLLHKIRYYLLIAAIFIFAVTALFTGAAIVSVNCHNAMNAERISLFEIEKRDGETVITVMGHEYKTENEDSSAGR